jgi:RNA polymerase sigma factor (TIGR02999 family)
MTRRTEVSAVLAELRGESRGTVMDRLLPLVYGELRSLARAQLRSERTDHTLQATALVHEAYLRMLGGSADFNDQQHFFRAAAEAMRRILIEHARGRERIKRGGKQLRVELSSVDLAVEHDPDQVLALDEAFRRLEGQDPEAADVVRLRFYAGLSVEETAQATGRSERTVKREWAFARAWLYDALSESGAPTRGETHGDGPVGAGEAGLSGSTRKT